MSIDLMTVYKGHFIITTTEVNKSRIYQGVSSTFSLKADESHFLYIQGKDID